MFFFNFDPPIRKMEGKKDVAGLVKALKHGDRNIRLSAAQALGRLGDKQAVEPLLNIFTSIEYINNYLDSGGAYREALAEINGIRDIDSIIFLIDGIETYNCGKYAIRSLLGFALGGEKNPLTTVLFRREWNIMRAAAAKALGKIGDDRVVETLIRGYHGLDNPEDCVNEKSFRPRDLPVVQPIIRACRDSEQTVRQAVIEALGRIGDQRAVELLLTVLNNPANPAFETAAQALALLREKRAVEPLLTLLGSADFKLRLIAVKTLGELGDARAARPLAETLRDSELHVCEAAADSLLRLGLPAKEHLRAALKDSDLFVRKLAAKTLSQTK